MKRPLLVTLVAIWALGFIVSTAGAQCSFEHPGTAKKLKASLVQAFVPCDSGFANTTTEGGVASCATPETFNQQAGSPADGWLWDEFRAAGEVSFQPLSIVKTIQIGTALPGANPASPLNPVGNVADLLVRLQLYGIGSLAGPGESGTGTLATVLRLTLDDRVSGDMTVVDFPANFPFDLLAGKAKLKTSAAALLNSIGQPALPPCTNIEVLTAFVLDENGNTFANMGAYLPGLSSLYTPECDDFEHPRKAKGLQARLTQAMVSCGNPGGNTPNTQTEGGVPSCKPAETVNEDAGSPANGWVWGPTSFGSVQLKAGKNKIVSPLNPPTNSQDLFVTLKLDHIFDDHGVVANAPGTLAIVVRTTFTDREGGEMTVIDYPLNFAFTVQGGQLAMKTTVNALLNGMGKPGLPKCTSIEILSVDVLDQNGNRFATLGNFLPGL